MLDEKQIIIVVAIVIILYFWFSESSYNMPISAPVEKGDVLVKTGNKIVAESSEQLNIELQYVINALGSLRGIDETNCKEFKKLVDAAKADIEAWVKQQSVTEVCRSLTRTNNLEDQLGLDTGLYTAAELNKEFGNKTTPLTAKASIVGLIKEIELLRETIKSNQCIISVLDLNKVFSILEFATDEHCGFSIEKKLASQQEVTQNVNFMTQEMPIISISEQIQNQYF